jgi:cyclase
MVGRSFNPFSVFVVAALLIGASSPLQVAQAQQAVDFSKVKIKTTRLADNFYTLEGQGGTISVLTGPDGVLLVDSQFAPLTDKLAAAIRAISDRPIRFLINTHVHGDQPAPDGTPGKPAPAQALPVVTYDGPVTIHVNGEQVQLLPIRSAHTDGDTLVSFPRLDILAVGDYIRTVGYPRADLRNGGSLKGLLAGLGETIGRAGPRTRIIPGHGAITDRNGVIAQRDLILAVRDKVAPLVQRGLTVEEVLANKPTADYDANVPQSEQTAEQFVRWLYAELKAGR